MSEFSELPLNVTKAITLAEEIQNTAEKLITPQYKRMQRLMGGFISHPGDKVLFTEMIDQGLRPRIKNVLLKE